jgi:hypothetical protein
MNPACPKPAAFYMHIKTSNTDFERRSIETPIYKDIQTTLLPLHMFR